MIWLAWGAVIGSAAQFLVQLPTVIAILRSLRPSLAIRDPGVQTTLRAFVPIVLGRGSVQLSGYIDQVLASYLGDGHRHGDGERADPRTSCRSRCSAWRCRRPSCPRCRRDRRRATRAAHLQARLAARCAASCFSSCRRRSRSSRSVGRSSRCCSRAVSSPPTTRGSCGSSSRAPRLGLSAGTQGRLLGSAFYALGDPTRPLYAALVRVAITGVAGYAFALALRDALGSSALITLLGRISGVARGRGRDTGLRRRVGRVRPHRERPASPRGSSSCCCGAGSRGGSARCPFPAKLGLGCLAAAIVAGGAGYGTNLLVGSLSAHIAPRAIAAIAVFGLVYFAITTIAKIPEAHAFTRRLRRR